MPTCAASANIARRDIRTVSRPGCAPMLDIDIPGLEEVKALALVKGVTCNSLYLPTYPIGSSAKVNRTAFKDLAKEALSQLKEAGIGKAGIAAFEHQFDRLAGAEPDVQDQDKVREQRCAKPD